VFTHILGKPKELSLYSKKTDWNYFRETLDEQITLTIPLKVEIDIEEAVENNQSNTKCSMAGNPRQQRPNMYR
jgi:hypothetical protein